MHGRGRRAQTAQFAETQPRAARKQRALKPCAAPEQTRTGAHDIGKPACACRTGSCGARARCCRVTEAK